MTRTLDAVGRASSRSILARILEAPDLAMQIEALEPPVLRHWIDRIGLEDAGVLVAFATTEQLASIFDDDLWRSDRPGEDAHFDAERFSTWLEVMLEGGDAFVAEKLTTLPEDLVTLAFHTQILVVHQDALITELEAGDDDARATEKALASCLSEDIDEYVVIARRPEGWDNVLAAILALDRDHHSFVARLLERCCALSAEVIEDNGTLCDVLRSEDMLAEDVAGDRDDRRSEAGHVAPSAAAAFLKLARMEGETSLAEHDPMTRAYLRGLARNTHLASPRRAPRQESALAALLREGAVHASEGAAPRLAAHTGATDARDRDEPILARAMRILAVDDAEAHASRSEELAYLANVLAAGCALRGRRFRPAEAVRAAIATTNLGLELSLQNTRDTSADAVDALDAAVLALRRSPADALFRRAWRALVTSVSTPAARLAKRAQREPLEPEDDEPLRALADECPSLAGSIARTLPAIGVATGTWTPTASAPRESERDAVRFITTKRDMEAAVSFLIALGARLTSAR